MPGEEGSTPQRPQKCSQQPQQPMHRLIWFYLFQLRVSALWAQERGRSYWAGGAASQSPPGGHTYPQPKPPQHSQDLRSRASVRPGWGLAVVLAVPRLCAWLLQGGLSPQFWVLDSWPCSPITRAGGSRQGIEAWVLSQAHLHVYSEPRRPYWASPAML